MEQNDPPPPDAKPLGSKDPNDVSASVPAESGGLTADQATRMLGDEVAKRRRIATATQSGARMLTIGLLFGVLAGALSWLAPPGLLASAATPIGIVAGLVGGFGALRLFAAWQLDRR